MMQTDSSTSKQPIGEQQAPGPPSSQMPGSSQLASTEKTPPFVSHCSAVVSIHSPSLQHAPTSGSQVPGSSQETPASKGWSKQRMLGMSAQPKGEQHAPCAPPRPQTPSSQLAPCTKLEPKPSHSVSIVSEQPPSAEQQAPIGGRLSQSRSPHSNEGTKSPKQKLAVVSMQPRNE